MRQEQQSRMLSTRFRCFDHLSEERDPFKTIFGRSAIWEERYRSRFFLGPRVSSLHSETKAGKERSALTVCWDRTPVGIERQHTVNAPSTAPFRLLLTFRNKIESD